MGKKSTKTSNKTVYGNTTTTNPYVTSQTNNNGTVTSFNKGTALDTVNNFVNNNMGELLNQYLNPTLESVTNKAKMNAFINNMNAETSKNIENNIINPLSNRNMIRSSQATNMYNNLANTNANNLANYTNELLANSQSDTADLLGTLMLLYMNGYNAISNTQQQSLSASQGNATKTQNTVDSGIDLQQTLNTLSSLALQSLFKTKV